MSAFSSKTPKSKGRASNALPVDDLLFEDEEDLAHHHTGGQAPNTESFVSDKELPEARDYVPTEAPCTLLKAESFQRKRPTISKKPEKKSKEAEEEENSESVVLEEELPEDYEPTEEEVLEYAKWLGMDIQSERDLFWLAREGLKAPLPENWKPCKTGGGEIYYFNFATGESVWDHPCDEFYRKVRATHRITATGECPAFALVRDLIACL
jgi:hypothetical protein